MPAVSKAQRKLMGMAYAVKKGKISPKSVSAEIRRVANTMSLRELKKYASTDEKQLPAKVKRKS